MLIELWPEYDRPEVLVIYRVALSVETALPASLTFYLPGYIETMNAVAYEENGNLFAINQDIIEQRREDVLLLTFSTPSRQVQLEYYDPLILTRQGQMRRLDFAFLAPYDIETVSIEVQEPAQAENFSLKPAPARTFTGHDGLNYSVLDLATLAPGDTITLTATYQRESEELSIRQPGVISEHAEDIVEVDSSARQNITLAYILMGAGLVTFLGAIAHWWWFNRRQAPATKRRSTTRLGRAKKRQPARPEKAKVALNSSDEVQLGFCYKCGAALRPEANFCHNCGARRR
jgi:hypothetical protein